MNQHLTNFLAIWGSVLSTVLLVFKIIESKKYLTVLTELKETYYETEEGDQILKVINVKVINKTNYNISIQNITFTASRFFFFTPINQRSILFQRDDEITITLFKPGESKIYNYDMSYIHSDGGRNIDILKDYKLKNYFIRAGIICPDNSITYSKIGILINSILRN